jgi:dihydrofolate reductase
MASPFTIIGYAIVSSDGMIADQNAMMPNSLKFEADQRYFEDALDKVDVVVHGRHSHEGQPNSALRRRLIMTRSVPALAPDASGATLWNPAGASLTEACAAVGVSSGVVGILGGPVVYGLFLDSYVCFHLSRAANVAIPGGTPVFVQTPPARTPEETLTHAGLKPGPVETLDAANALTLVIWARPMP